jgi:hypothetical protein
MRSISKIRVSVKRDFQEWLEKTLSNCRYIPRKRLECNDGFNMSIQGGENSYSKPRQFGTNFIEMEVGFPSEYEELIKDYTNSEYYTDTFYPYVPVSLIIEVIEKHGGIKKD